MLSANYSIPRCTLGQPYLDRNGQEDYAELHDSNSDGLPPPYPTHSITSQQQQQSSPPQHLRPPVYTEQHMQHPFESPEKLIRASADLSDTAVYPHVPPGAMSNRQHRQREEQQRHLHHQALLSQLQDQMPQRAPISTPTTVCQQLPPLPPTIAVPKMALLPSLGIPEQQRGNRRESAALPRNGDLFQKLQQQQNTSPPSSSLSTHPTTESLPWYNDAKGCLSSSSTSTTTTSSIHHSGVLVPPIPSSVPSLHYSRRCQPPAAPSAPPLSLPVKRIVSDHQLELLRPPPRMAGRQRPQYPHLTDPGYAAHLLSTVSTRDLQRLYVHAAHHLHSHQPIRRYVLMKCIMTQAELTQYGRLRAEMPRAPGPSTGARPKPTGFGTKANTGLEAHPKVRSRLGLYMTSANGGDHKQPSSPLCPPHHHHHHHHSHHQRRGSERADEARSWEQERDEEETLRDSRRKRPARSCTVVGARTITTATRTGRDNETKKLKGGGRGEEGEGLVESSSRVGHRGRFSKGQRHDVVDDGQGGRTEMNGRRVQKLERIEILASHKDQQCSRETAAVQDDDDDDDEELEEGQDDDFWTELRRKHNRSRRRSGQLMVVAKDKVGTVGPVVSHGPQPQPNGRRRRSLDHHQRSVPMIQLSLKPMLTTPSSYVDPQYHKHPHQQQQQQPSTISIQGIVKRFFGTASLSELKRSLTVSSATPEKVHASSFRQAEYNEKKVPRLEKSQYLFENDQRGDRLMTGGVRVQAGHGDDTKQEDIYMSQPFDGTLPQPVQEQHHHHFHQLHQSILAPPVERVNVVSTTTTTTTTTTSADVPSFTADQLQPSPQAHGRSRGCYVSPINTTLAMMRAGDDDNTDEHDNSDDQNASLLYQDSPLVQPLLPQGHPHKQHPQHRLGHDLYHHNPLSSLSPTSPTSPLLPSKEHHGGEQAHLTAHDLSMVYIRQYNSHSPTSSSSSSLATPSSPLHGLRSRSYSSTSPLLVTTTLAHPHPHHAHRSSSSPSSSSSSSTTTTTTTTTTQTRRSSLDHSSSASLLLLPAHHHHHAPTTNSVMSSLANETWRAKKHLVLPIGGLATATVVVLVVYMMVHLAPAATSSSSSPLLMLPASDLLASFLEAGRGGTAAAAAATAAATASTTTAGTVAETASTVVATVGAWAAWVPSALGKTVEWIMFA